MKKKYLKNEHGLAMPELLVAIAVILIVLTSSAYVLINGLRTQTETEDRDTAVQLVRDEIEKARAMTFSNLSLDSSHLTEVSSGKYAVDFNARNVSTEHKLKGEGSYAEDPLTNPVLGNSDGLNPWVSVVRGADAEQDIPGVEYLVRTDVTYYSPSNDTDYRSKEVTVTAYWNNGNKDDSVTMSWIRTPSLSEAEPSGTTTEDSITLQAPTNVSYTYNALGTHMDVSWYFEQSEVSANSLSFEVFTGTPTNMKRVRTEAGEARNSITIPVNGATRLFVRAVYRGETADSSTVTLAAPTVITAPAAPTITGTQVAGTTTALFSFAPVSQATNYNASYRVNEGAWVNLGAMSPNVNWTSEALDSGGKIEFAVYASNVAGSSEMAVSTVNVVGKPDVPVLSEPRQSLMNAIFSFSPAARADSYRAQWKLNDGPWQNIASPTPNRDIVLNGQEPGNVVHVRVASYSNLSGISEYANISYEMLPPPPEPEIYVSEQRPGVAVFGFEESPSAESYEAAWRVGTGSWRALSGITPGDEIHIPWTASADQTVNFRVRAFNEITGYSGYSTASIDMKTPPVSPVISAATQVGGEARFTFQSVARAQDYLVEYQVGEDGDWMVVDGATPNTTIIVSGTGAHDEIITLRVTAMNGQYGDSTPATRAVTMLGRPAAPSIDKAEQDDRDAVFRFAPSDYATSYRLEYQVGEGNAWTSYSSPRANTDIRIPGNGRMNELVTIRVWASNVAGESEVAESSVNLVGAPDAPVITLSEQRLMKAYFKFDESAGADFYHVRYRINSGSWTTLDPAETFANEEVAVDAAAGQTVNFEVWASNASGSSSVSISSVKLVAPPTTPIINRNEQTSASVAVFRYTAVSGATSYEAQYRIGSGSWITVNLNPSVNYSVQNLTAGDNVQFRVRATNAGGTSNWAIANVVMISPPARPNWSYSTPADNGTEASFRFTSVANATSYTVRYRINGGTWRTPSVTSPNTYINIPAGAGQTVEMEVTANNIAGSSPVLSGSVTLLPIPAAPSVTGTALTPSSAQFSWDPVPHATSYEREQRCGTGSWSSTTTTTSTTHSFSCTSGETASIRVRAVNASGASAWATASALLPAPPGAPTVSVSSRTHTAVTFSWNAVTYATGYEYRTRTNAGTWSAWTSNGTSRTRTVNVGPVQGNDASIEVRAVNNRGSGPTSGVVKTHTTIQHPDVSGWIVTSSNSNTRLNFQIINRYNRDICPSGLAIQSRHRDKVQGRPTWANDWGSWRTKAATATPRWSSNSHASGATGSTVVVQEQEVRCYNATSGNYGTAEWATFNMSHVHTPWDHRVNAA